MASLKNDDHLYHGIPAGSRILILWIILYSVERPGLEFEGHKSDIFIFSTWNDLIKKIPRVGKCVIQKKKLN